MVVYNLRQTAEKGFQPVELEVVLFTYEFPFILGRTDIDLCNTPLSSSFAPGKSAQMFITCIYHGTPDLYQGFSLICFSLFIT